MRRSSASLVLWLCAAAPVSAQDPLSAIDWLDEASTASVSVPVAAPNMRPLNEPPAVQSVTIPSVTITALDAPRADAVGLLPAATTGLPASLWQNSAATPLIRRLSQLESEPLPAIQALYYTLLLAEAKPPADTGAGARFLLARLAALRGFGAVEPAQALVDRAGGATPLLFDEWLDLSFLLGQETRPCQALARQPHLSARLSARVFCIARDGDWSMAALTLQSAITLGALTEPDATLLMQFLDPEMIEDMPPPGIPDELSALQFRLFEAIGAPLSTRSLPRAFAIADLRGTSGWKSEIEAAERLARTGAVPGARLMGLYTSREPAASGGVWDRVEAVQALDRALDAPRPDTFGAILRQAWEAARRTHLEVVFADLFAERLLTQPLPVGARALAFDIVLLSGRYEEAGALLSDPTPAQRFLIGTARGAPPADAARRPLERAVLEGFADQAPPPPQAALLEAGRLGEAILEAAAQVTRGANEARADFAGALTTLRAVGLEDTARRAALQALLLERQG